MNTMNRVILIGHVGPTAPELRATASGDKVTRITILTNNARKVDGAWVETQDTHRVLAYGRTADFLVKYAKPGDLLAVDCVLRPRKWEDAEGKTQHEVEIVVDRIAALHSRAGAVTAPARGPDGKPDDTDIPF